MYAYISGVITHKEPTHVILENNGIGYEIKIPLSVFEKVKTDGIMKVFTHLHVKEDAHTLYGFLSEDDKKLFLMLTEVSGIGPSTGLALLSYLSSDDLRKAIASENINAIKAVKGIGLKTAQRLILELKDKVKKDGISGEINLMTDDILPNVKEEAILALVTLGFTRMAAEKSIIAVAKKYGKGLAVEDLIKFALKDN
jgi:Holliday junction DNA helicase RuvA